MPISRTIVIDSVRAYIGNLVTGISILRLIPTCASKCFQGTYASIVDSGPGALEAKIHFGLRVKGLGA